MNPFSRLSGVLSGMHIRHFAVVALLLFPGAAGAQLTTGTTSVVLQDKTVVRVESSTIQVPESRARPSTRKVTIPFYRLKSEASTPAAPIFLLAGEPGGPGWSSSRRKRPIGKPGSTRASPTSSCSTSVAPAAPRRR